MGKFSFDTETTIEQGAETDVNEFFNGFSEPVEEFEIPEQEELEPEYFDEKITGTANDVITRAKLMNELFYEELKKLGYQKYSVILNTKVVNFMLNELLSIDYENRTELH